MDTDIRDEIERSFGDGPPTDDLDRLLETGRAAVRRRRVVEGGSLLLVAAAVTVAALLSTGNGTDSTSPQPADQPRATQAAEPSTPSETPVVPDDSHPDVIMAVDRGLPADAPVAVQSDGVVGLRPGVQVVRTIADPFENEDLTASAAVEYTWRGTTYWFVGYMEEGGGGTAVQPVLSTMSFRAWIRAQRPIQGSATDVAPDAGGDWPGRVDLELVRFVGDTQRLAPLAGVTILQQRAHPDLTDSFATADDRSAVAEVRSEGRRWYVLARSAAGSGPQFITVSAGKGGDTLEEFLVLAQERYAEGGGGLL